MHYEGQYKLRSHNTSYCLSEVVTKSGLTVSAFLFYCVDLCTIFTTTYRLQITSTEHILQKMKNVGRDMFFASKTIFNFD